jgi:hypothetical protein
MTSWSCSEPCKQVIHLLKPIPSSQWQAIWHKCFNNLLVWLRTLQPFLLILATQLLLHSIYLFPHNHMWPSLSHMLHLPCVHNYTQNKFPPSPNQPHTPPTKTQPTPDSPPYGMPTSLWPLTQRVRVFHSKPKHLLLYLYHKLLPFFKLQIPTPSPYQLTLNNKPHTITNTTNQ